MTDTLTTDKGTYAPGEPITIIYQLDGVIAGWGLIPLGIQKNDGAHFDPDIQFQPILSGPQVRTFTFPQNGLLSPGPYAIIGHEGSMQDQNFANFTVQNNVGWTVLGPGFVQFAACCDVLYGLDATGVISTFTGDIGSWSPLQGSFRAIAGQHMGLYAVTADGAHTVQLNDDCETWTQIGDGMDGLVVAGDDLYGLKDGQILEYSGTAGSWTTLGAAGVQVVANCRYLFSRDAQGSVSMYTPAETGTGSWQTLPGTAGTLTAAENALYSCQADGTVSRYNGQGSVWETVGAGMSNLAAGGTTLLGTGPDGQVWMFSGTAGQWQQFAGPASTIMFGEELIFASTSAGTAYLDPKGAPVQTTETPLLKGSAPASGMLGEGTNPANWIFTFATANRWLAGYDGEVHLEAQRPDGTVATASLESQHFERGVTYTFPLYIDAPDISQLKVYTDDNFFSEQWDVDSITAWSIINPKLLTWNVNGDIKLPGQHPQFAPPDIVTPLAPSPTGCPVVYVWTFRGSFSAWGHASLSLSTGDHISWWPDGPHASKMPFLSKIYSADPVPNMTLDMDIASEAELQNGHKMPDIGIPIRGLNEQAILTWWNGFKTTHKWKTLSQNCSTTVYDALLAGGANSILTSREADDFAEINVWTPANVLQLAYALQAHG